MTSLAASKKVAIVIFNRVQIIDFSGPYEVFSDAGYDVYTVAQTKQPIVTAAGDGMMITPKYTFADAPKADILVIPGGDHEAPRGSAITQWIAREAAHATHIMSVCNGAFTLANSGLLNGLRATTTAGHLARLRRDYPHITVVDDQHVVDNGKIVCTAGLSAGIDGALHMLDVLKGDGAGQSVALGIEYDWRPRSGYARGVMADRLIPRIELTSFGELTDFRVRGDLDRWEVTRWLTTDYTAGDVMSALTAAYEQGYAVDGLWNPESFRLTPSGITTADLRFTDRAGGSWGGYLTVAVSSADAPQLVVTLAIERMQ